jgi:NADH-quinone oxidoreductase subunit L
LIGKLTIFPDIDYIQLKITWFALSENFKVNVGIGIDNLSALMLIVVTLISFLVHVFSIEYMFDDKRYTRYFAYLGLFTFSMLGIVITNNFLFMYVFWELVGLSSYLLIGFWYEKDSAANAGKKAFIVNRIGDLGFFIGILMVFFAFGSFLFDDIFNANNVNALASKTLPFGLDPGTFLTISGVLLFCGAIGKSAQFPLHVWLPDAMEGPTPVSALIHAATMVAAGVFLVARIFPMLTANALTIIAYFGAITAFISATIAITQNDFKKVLAYSTVSQLGYMVMGLGVGAFTMGFFHLVTHAWFKACLFLASGSVIHAMHHSMHKAGDHHTDPQDINNMGGLRRTMPLTYITFLIATLAISGVPFTSGFLSKDGILAGTLAFGSLTGHWLIPIIGFLSAGITAFYMFRLTIVAFHGKPKTSIASHTHENKFVIVMPLVVLAVLSFWFFYSPDPSDGAKGWFAHSLPQPKTAVINYQFQHLVRFDQLHLSDNQESHNSNEAGHNESSNVTNDEHQGHSESHASVGHTASHGDNHFQEVMHSYHWTTIGFSLTIAGLGILFAFMVYQFKLFSAENMSKQMVRLYTFSYRKWYFDEIYQATVVNGTVGLAKLLAWFDLYVIDGIVNLFHVISRGLAYFIGHFDNIVIDGIVNLIAKITGLLGAIFRKFQTGRVQTYVIFVIIAIIVLIYLLV